MVRGHLIDLDELVLRCRDDEARNYVNEAVACYRVGAFRACIVSTWIAVVYDFIHKLRQLALIGDKNAQSKLADFEKARKDQSSAKALEFEKNILEWAVTDFEFISQLQKVDLERLLDDRNRCAHPSMSSEEEIYEATAEVARYHLRNAITHLLEHPPVQGKAALERLYSEVLSTYFPRTVDEALNFLSQSLLRNAKPVLIRNFLVLMLKEFLLLENFPDDYSQQRMISAISATRRMYRSQTEAIWKSEVNSVFQQIPKDKLGRAAKFLFFIPDTWEILGTDRQILLKNYANEMPKSDIACIAYMMEVPGLSDLLLQKLATLDVEQFITLIRTVPRKEYLSPCLELYAQSATIPIADHVATDLLIPLGAYFDASHAEQILRIIRQSSAVVISTKFEFVLEAVRSSKHIPLELVNEVFETYETRRLELAKDYYGDDLLRKSDE